MNKIYSIDLDENVVIPSEALYQTEYKEGKFIPITYDVNKIEWKEHNLIINEHTNKEHQYIPTQSPIDEKINMVINTSCEHIEKFTDWFKFIPKDKLVALQTNNYFELQEHVNCVKDINEFKQQAPLSNIIYEGELELEKYTRFMLIGYK